MHQGLTCNIDDEGRSRRLQLGSRLLTVGTGLAVSQLLARSRSRALCALSALLVLGGAFSTFEGLAGWCAARAAGFQTRY